MENHRTRSTVIRISFAAAVCLLTLAPKPAQSQGSVPGAPPVKDPFSEARERQQREAQLRSAEMVGPARIVNTRDLEAAAKRMQEDFKGIQVMRNNVVRHLQSEKPLDYKFIASETEGIHKRANRLKADLARESVEEEKKKRANRLTLMTIK